MRIFKVRRNSSLVSSDAENDSMEEPEDHDACCNQLNVNSNVMATESSQDLNKNILMSCLELQSTVKTEKSSPNNVASPLRPSFNWSDESMWKAMSRHPLFAKYMELQSQLNSLFEEIRLDCKKAACEKAFASLFKEGKASPSKSTPPPVLSKVSSETSPRKPVKTLKKRGRPRKCVNSKRANDWDVLEYTTTPASKSTRKSREELFLSRKPSWACNKCTKHFSSQRWLERHQSNCSISPKLSTTNPLFDDQKQEVTESVCAIPTESVSAIPTDGRDPLFQESGARDNVEYLGARVPNLNSSLHSAVTNRPESLSMAPNQTCSSSVSPLQPKMENQNLTEEDDTPKKTSFDSDAGRIPKDSSILHCKFCNQQYATLSLLRKHCEENPACKMPMKPASSDSIDYSLQVNASACKYCGRIFSRHRFLKRHQSLCRPSSKQKLWQCVHCLKSFSVQSRCESHEGKCRLQGKEGAFNILRCENCSLKFRSQKKLLKHQVICCPDSNNHMLESLKCPKCGVIFPTHKKQLKHRAICCPDKETECSVCKHCLKVFLMRDRMEAHREKCPS